MGSSAARNVSPWITVKNKKKKKGAIACRECRITEWSIDMRKRAQMMENNATEWLFLIADLDNMCALLVT